MAKITTDEVRKLADLSKLDLSKEEVEQYRHEIEQILGFLSQLDTIDTTGVEETSQVTGLQNVTRQDVIHDYGVDREQLLKNAPSTEKGYLKVKRVL